MWESKCEALNKSGNLCQWARCCVSGTQCRSRLSFRWELPGASLASPARCATWLEFRFGNWALPRLLGDVLSILVFWRVREYLLQGYPLMAKHSLIPASRGGRCTTPALLLHRQSNSGSSLQTARIPWSSQNFNNQLSVQHVLSP